MFDKASGPSTFDIITVAVWESTTAIENAIVAVRQYYEEIGFNPGEATANWGVAAQIGE